MKKSRILSSFLGCIDDLCIFNINEFENNYSYIYPNKLEIKKKNKDTCEALFLELSVGVCDRKITTNLFDEKMLFFFYGIVYHIQIAIYRLKYFMLWLI